jgi:hypothetical protein
VCSHNGFIISDSKAHLRFFLREILAIFLVQFFCIFFRFCLRGLFPPGVKVLWSFAFFTVLFPAVEHFGPVFRLEESDKQQIALHFSYIFFPRFLRFLALSVAAGFSVGDYCPPLVAEERGTRLLSMEEAPETEGRKRDRRQAVLNSVLLRE